MDLLLTPHDDREWVYKRDDRIRLPLADVIRRGSDGVPYQAPEIGLLFKARLDRTKDVIDLVETWPRLDLGARQWLRSAIELTESVDHPWLRRVDAQSRP